MTPGLGLLLGALLLPFLPAFLRRAWVPALALLTLLTVASLTPGDVTTAHFWGHELEILRVDPIRLLFGWAFSLALLLWGIYAWEVDDRLEKAAVLACAGCALLVVFSGSWLVLLLGWEGMGVAATGVLVAGRTREAWSAGLRFFVVQILAGVLVMAGSALVHTTQHSWDVVPLALEGLGPWLVFLGFAIGAAAWPLSAWLPDAVPEASPSGSVPLALYTPTTAAFALALVFPGTPLLLVLGALMALYGMLYALFTRHYRRLLVYALVGQMGVVLCAVGAGPAPGAEGFTLGQSAAAAHAFSAVLFHALLFMTAGVVLLRTGRVQGGGFGGLRRQLPWTFGFAVVGAAAIAAVPLTNGYASLSLVREALAEADDRTLAFTRGVLAFVAAGAPLFVGLRYLWLTFAGREEDVRAEPASLPMRFGMGAGALLCLALGLAPGIWMRHLPAAGEAAVFRGPQVTTQLGLLAIGVAAFVLWRTLAARVLFGPPHALPDADGIWRGGARRFVAFVQGPFQRALTRISNGFHESVPQQLAWISQNPAGFFRVAFERIRLGVTAFFGSARMIDRAQARFAAQLDTYRSTRAAATWPIGRTVFYISLILALALVVWLVR